MLNAIQQFLFIAWPGQFFLSVCLSCSVSSTMSHYIMNEDVNIYMHLTRLKSVLLSSFSIVFSGFFREGQSTEVRYG